MHMSERDWNMCSKFNNHSRLNIQYGEGRGTEHLMSTKIFTLKMNMISY